MTDNNENVVVSENLSKTEKVEVIEKLKNKNVVKESLSFEELKKVIDACETIQEKALIELAVTTGIRREDIVKIEIINIDLEKRRIVFWEEKKNRWWVVALEPRVVQTLKMYLNTLPKDQRYLFPFSGRTAYNIFQRLLKRAGISKHLPFHALRRTFIRLSKKMGRDIRFVMDQTGDRAETIISEYEGYTIDERVEILDKDGILKRIEGQIL